MERANPFLKKKRSSPLRRAGTTTTLIRGGKDMSLGGEEGL